jgi:hypothetical protein
MSYTVIEDIVENPLTSKYKNQQANNPNMWSNGPKQSMRPDFANNPQYDPNYNRYAETSPMPMEYGAEMVQDKQVLENNKKRSSIAQVMSSSSSENIPAPLPKTTSETQPVTNEKIKKMLENMADNMKETSMFFYGRIKNIETKLVMIDQIIKGIGIILILLLIFMMIKK